MNTIQPVLAPQYQPAVFFALGSQLAVGVLALMMLDGGRLARVVGLAALAFWLLTAIVIARRPFAPSFAALVWTRWGFWPVLAIVATIFLAAV